MNACQDRWALFLNRFNFRFNFTLAYHPGSKNQKADALCHQHDERDSEPIIPSSRIVAPVYWNIETKPRPENLRPAAVPLTDFICSSATMGTLL